VQKYNGLPYYIGWP